MNIPEVRFINLEYIFYKIYDFFGRIFGNGTGNNGFGNSSITHMTFGEWFRNLIAHGYGVVITILAIVFIFSFCVIIWTRMHISELDAARKKKFKEHFVAPAPKPIGKVNTRWDHVLELFASSNSNDWRMAIIEADTMLDELVASYNFPGENLGERLKNVNTNVMPTVQSAWEAHKVRNRIAHDGMEYNLSEREAQLTKRHFEFVFRDAGII